MWVPIPFVFLFVSKRFSNLPAVGEKTGRKVSPQKSEALPEESSFRENGLHFFLGSKGVSGKISDEENEKRRRNPAEDVAPVMGGFFR
ncbi:MAG: hypothetical protein LKJ88_06955 [Bacilli bacterium]|jgi:hypothetical protein|nr:hypothetical protein [Bacilli bacterium]